jgi:hypothetical protein
MIVYRLRYKPGWPFPADSLAAEDCVGTGGPGSQLRRLGAVKDSRYTSAEALCYLCRQERGN